MEDLVNKHLDCGDLTKGSACSSREELLAPELARKLLGWKHSGFSVHNGKPLRRDDGAGLERVAQYIIRNPFFEQKMVYNAENGTVIYRSVRKSIEKALVCIWRHFSGPNANDSTNRREWREGA